MSQLLSDAHKSYNEGISLINQGRRSGGLESLSRAQQKTEEVKLMFPVNQDASILQLRIAQVTDPATFPAMFRDRFTNDMALIRQLRQAATEQFADLQDLAAINPGYPGIQAALTEAEILIGLRPPPPDPAALARSMELTREARTLVDTAANSQVQMEIALGTVNQALSLNPNNEQAMALKSTIVSIIGGSGGGSGIAQYVLTADAEVKFKRAQQEFTQGRYINAYGILQELLQDTRNRNVQKVIDLERRTRAML
jgi:tetratricopeptide (TPR) repeat protein